jgi:HK97 family phage portal protein
VADSRALTVIEPPVIRLSVMDRIRTWGLPKPRTSLDRLPAGSGQPMPQAGQGLFTLINQNSGFVSKSNASVYRAWSEASPWVRAAIDILRDAVSSAEWDILPVDKSGPKNVRTAKRIRDLFTEPNASDSFWSWSQKLVEDISVLDAGVVELVRYPSSRRVVGEIAELWPVMGETIHVNARWDGSDDNQARYIWAPDGTVRGMFTNNDLMYVMSNPRTNSVVGLSPLEVLQKTIAAELNSMDYNSRMVRGAPPEGVLDIGESAMQEDVRRTKTEWESEILGQSSFAIIGGYKNPQFLKFRDTNQEMQYREWLDYLVRQIAVVFGLSPMDLGITFDVNRSTAEQQGDNTEGRGMKPLMAMLQTHFTRNIVQDASFGGRDNNLCFAFTALNLKESLNRAQINKIAVGSTPWKTVNEARLMEGRPPLGELNDEDNVFNHVLALTPKGLMDITTAKYIGEEDLARIQSDSAIDLAEATAEARAANPDKTQPADTASSKEPARG